MPFVRLMTESRDLNQVQNNIATAFNPLLINPLLNGNFLTEIDLISGVNVIPHGLDRTPQGWMITDIDGAAVIYRSAAFTTSLITLTSDAAVTVNIYVF